MLNQVKKIIPPGMLQAYHLGLAWLANVLSGRPSWRMVVIGVTGTNGKSSTARLIGEVLARQGKTVGFISTAEIQIGAQRYLNNLKMTMPGRFHLQRLLKQMLRAGCEYAIVETSSQGVEQFRHLGINYDLAVFTNLTPEHIEAHGGFANYKAAKGKFFAHLKKFPPKKLNGKSLPKISVVNVDDPHARFFLDFPADQKFGYGIRDIAEGPGIESIWAKGLALTPHGASFTVNGTRFQTNLLGEHNVYNCLAAITAGRALGFPIAAMAETFFAVIIPGRMEFIQAGQSYLALVDYAPEPQSLSQLYATLKFVPHHRIIHVLGSCGGGRDRKRRKVLGRMAGRYADIVITTNEDPYDDDPMEIIREVAEGAAQEGKVEGKDMFSLLDRKEAIARAVNLAQPGDLVLVTGKGSEQAMVVANSRKIKWDDRVVLRDAIMARAAVEIKK